MESYFREHMASRQLSGFHETVAPHLAAYPDNVGKASAAQQRDYLTHLHQTLNAPSHPIRNRLLRLTADKRNGIENDARLWATETMGNAKSPLELFLRVITVSLETMKLVNALPPIGAGLS